MFRQIPIEISVGCAVVLVTPVSILRGQLPQIEIIHSTVGKIKVNGPDKWIYAEDPKIAGNYIKIPDWRIARYTYGGIWLDNRKFDQGRIDIQNLNIVQKKSPATPSKTASTNPGVPPPITKRAAKKP